MKCAVHSEVDATGYCRNCGKALCAVCVRPVHDVFYCEDCLAAVLGHTAPAPAAPQAAAFAPGAVSAPAPRAPSAGSPGVAFVLGFFPGMGAVYNGEYNKALIQIVVFAAMIVGLSSDIGEGPEVALSLLLAGFIFYMAIDAMRTAQSKQRGETPADPLESWSKNRPIGPIILIVLGAIFLLNNFNWFPFYRLVRFWPLILIIAGGLMFRNRLSGRS
ncbi:MAG: LiaI-LiaF-like domain-containing protein [Candidatus Acidiferrales bacterium]